MLYGLKQTTAPSAEPVTWAEAKQQCRIDEDGERTQFEDILIPAARAWCEEYTGRQFLTATWKLYLDYFPSLGARGCPYFFGNSIVLPWPPLASVSSITYLDNAGASQTWSSTEYRVTAGQEPARIEPAHGYSWPSIRHVVESIIVTYTAGYHASALADAQAPLKQAMLLLIGQLYLYREPQITGTIVTDIDFTLRALLDPFKTGWVW